MKNFEEKHSSSMKYIDDRKTPTRVINNISDNFNKMNLYNNVNDNEINSFKFDIKNFSQYENTTKREKKLGDNDQNNFLNFHRKNKLNQINNSSNNEKLHEEVTLKKDDLKKIKNIKINFQFQENLDEIENKVIENFKNKPKKNNENVDLENEIKNNKKIKEEYQPSKINGKEMIIKIFGLKDDKNISHKIRNLRMIKTLLKYLIQNENEESDEFIFNFLLENFSKFRINVNLFTKLHIKKFDDYFNLVDIIIKKILVSSQNKNQILKINLLAKIFSYIGCNKNEVEKILKRLLQYYIIPDNQNLDKNDSYLLFNSINILKSIFSINDSIKFPKNYIYFSGNKGIQISKNNNIEKKKM